MTIFPRTLHIFSGTPSFLQPMVHHRASNHTPVGAAGGPGPPAGPPPHACPAVRSLCAGTSLSLCVQDRVSRVCVVKMTRGP